MSKTVFSALLPGRALISIGGVDAEPFLQGLLSCDVRKVSGDTASLGALLSPQGKFLFDFFLFKDGEDFLLDAEEERADELIKKLSMYRLRAKVSIMRREGWNVLALVGLPPASAPGALVFADPRHAAMGWRLYGPLESLRPANGAFEDYDTLRLTLGLPDGSRDAVAERTILLENGYDHMGGVDFAKGCYVGQEVTARSRHRGELRKYLFQVASDSPLPPKGTPVMAGENAIGEMRSSCGGLGLALMRTDLMEAAKKEGLAVTAHDAALRISSPWWHAREEARA